LFFVADWFFFYFSFLVLIPASGSIFQFFFFAPPPPFFGFPGRPPLSFFAWGAFCRSTETPPSLFFSPGVPDGGGFSRLLSHFHLPLQKKIATVLSPLPAIPPLVITFVFRSLAQFFCHHDPSIFTTLKNSRSPLPSPPPMPKCRLRLHCLH